MEENKTFAVIGGGSWATALMKILCENMESVYWYMRNPQTIQHIQKIHHNPKYLSSVKFNPSQLKLTHHIDEAIQHADCIIFAVPSAFLYKELQNLTVSLKNKIIYSAIKGIVPETGTIVGEFFHQKYNVPFDNIGVISGPCHAEEVALERLSYLTIASTDPSKAELLATVFDNHYIRCNISEDVIGTEYAAVLKNIYAIACGMYHALGYGDNFQSVLMSNAIREISKFVENLDSQTERNINDSAYLGDLLVTGYSSFSRNRMFGTMIGKGYSVQQAQTEMNMIAEGYYATRCAYALNQTQKDKADIPIIEAVFQVLYENREVSQTMFNLTQKLN